MIFLKETRYYAFAYFRSKTTYKITKIMCIHTFVIRKLDFIDFTYRRTYIFYIYVHISNTVYKNGISNRN